MIYIAVLCNPKITAEPLYSTPIVHWTYAAAYAIGPYATSTYNSLHMA